MLLFIQFTPINVLHRLLHPDITVQAIKTALQSVLSHFGACLEVCATLLVESELHGAFVFTGEANRAFGFVGV